MRMKRLYLDNSLAILAVPVVTFPMAWVCNRWLQGTIAEYSRIRKSRNGFKQTKLLWHEYLLASVPSLGLYQADSQKTIH